MVWIPTVKMQKGDRVVTFNREEILQKRTEGWVEIGGTDNPTKLVEPNEDAGSGEIIPGIPPGPISEPLTPAQLVAEAEVKAKEAERTKTETGQEITE